MIYFSGRNNGVSEELTLKTNEITRKKSDYLEGTYAVHGIEEIMQPEEVVIVIDPFPAEMEKFKTTLVDGVGMEVIAVAEEELSGTHSVRHHLFLPYSAIDRLLMPSMGWADKPTHVLQLSEFRAR